MILELLLHDTQLLILDCKVLPIPQDQRLFRILYASFAGLNEFSELSALSYSPQMFAVNIRIQNPIEPDQLVAQKFATSQRIKK